MSDTTSRWNVPVQKTKLVAPWRREQPAEAVPSVPAEPRASAEWEQKAIAILVNRLDGESAAVGFARKERELMQLFATLTIAESRALYARLVVPREGDELARRIGGLVIERRTRLIAFVADARRREALAACGIGRCG